VYFVFLYIFFVISNFSQNKKTVKHLFLQIICNKATDKTWLKTDMQVDAWHIVGPRYFCQDYNLQFFW